MSSGILSGLAIPKAVTPRKCQHFLQWSSIKNSKSLNLKSPMDLAQALLTERHGTMNTLIGVSCSNLRNKQWISK